MDDLKAFTDEELEMIQERIEDWDWDLSQRNDVYELLPRLLLAARKHNETKERKTDEYRSNNPS